MVYRVPVDADTVCARAKIHFDPEKAAAEFSESGVTDSSETLEAYKRDFMALHSNQTGRMYFSVGYFVFCRFSVADDFFSE